MILFASFNSGNPVLGLLLLPFFIAGPFVLLWLEVRAFLRSEVQSWLPLALLIILGALAVFYSYAEGIRGFQQSRGFWRTYILACWIAAAAWPICLGWEAYKRGWLAKLMTKPKKKKRKAS